MPQPLDSFIGEGLVESPYQEQKKLAELWEANYYALFEFYVKACDENDILKDKLYGKET